MRSNDAVYQRIAGNTPHLRDLLAVIFVLAVATLAVLALLRQVEQYRWTQAASAAFRDHSPPRYDAPAFDSAARRKLAAETVGCVLVLACTLGWVLHRRRKRARIEQPTRFVTPRLPAYGRVGSGSAAAERLSAVVRSDRAVRQRLREGAA
jgi:hypothetical protein